MPHLEEFTLKKVPKSRYPQRVENQYSALLTGMVDEWRILIRPLLELHLPKIKRKYDVAVGRQDTYEDELTLLMSRIDLTMQVPMDRVIPNVKNILDQAGQFNARDWQRILVAVISVNIWRPESWYHTFLKERLKINTALIVNLNAQTRGQIREVISNGIRAGLSNRTLAAQILQQTDLPLLDPLNAGNTASVLRKSKHRADTIAVDQIGKWNGDLTRQRHADIGLSRYHWRTVLDRRVRGTPGGKFPNAVPSHFHREGKLYWWEGKKSTPPRTLPPPIGGHPGFPIRCRCYAEAFFDDLFVGEDDDE